MDETGGKLTTESPPVALAAAAPPRRAWPSALLAAMMLYLFIAAIHMMGHGLKTAAGDPVAQRQIHAVFVFANVPLAAFCVGLLVTSIVQSSSFTTSLIVAFVATGQISLPDAIPLIMGANVGTSITALLVSLGHIRRRREFRLALAGAATHSFFKILTVCVMFPLEAAFGVLSVPAKAAGEWLSRADSFAYDTKQVGVIKTLVAPLADGFHWLFCDGLGFGPAWAGGLIAIVALVLLFVALFFLVVGLKGALMQRIAGLFSRVLFARPWTGFLIGTMATALVQSSSVTTSLAVPLLGARVLGLRKVYPYMLGADVGTTVTAILAAVANAATIGQPEAAALGLSVAAAHLLFNLIGVAIFWPLGQMPMGLGKAFARLASHRRIWVLVGVVGLFFVLPAVAVAAVWVIG